jgi:hypothetical protein
MIKLIKYIIFIFIGIILYYIQKQYIETLSIGGLTVYYRKRELLPDTDVFPDFERFNLNDDEIYFIQRRILKEPSLLLIHNMSDQHNLMEDLIARRISESKFAPTILHRIIPEIPELQENPSQYHNILKRYTFKIGEGENNDDLPSENLSCSSKADHGLGPGIQLEPIEPIELPLGYRRCKTHDIEDDTALNPYDPTTGEFLKADIIFNNSKWLSIREISLNEETNTITFKCIERLVDREDNSISENITRIDFEIFRPGFIDQNLLNRLGILDGINLEVFTYPMVQDPTILILESVVVDSPVNVLDLRKILTIGEINISQQTYSCTLDGDESSLNFGCIFTNDLVIYEKDGVFYQALVIDMNAPEHYLTIRVFDHATSLRVHSGNSDLYYRHKMDTDELINHDTPNLYLIQNSDFKPIVLHTSDFFSRENQRDSIIERLNIIKDELANFYPFLKFNRFLELLKEYQLNRLDIFKMLSLDEINSLKSSFDIMLRNESRLENDDSCAAQQDLENIDDDGWI